MRFWSALLSGLIFLSTAVTSLAQTKDSACESALLNIGQTYIELTKKALERRLIQSDDLKTLLSLEHPANPLASKTLTMESVALNTGFEKVLSDSLLRQHWNDVKVAIARLLDQTDIDRKHTKVAHQETQYVLSPNLIENLRFENANLPVLHWGESRQLQIAYFFPDDLTLKTSQSLITTKRGSNVGLHMLTDEDTRERGRISRGQIEWSKEGELEGAFVRRDQKVFFKNFSTDVQSPYFSIGDNLRIDDSGHFEMSKLSDGTRFLLYQTDKDVRLFFPGKKPIVIPGAVVAPLFAAANGEHYFSVKDLDRTVGVFVINSMGEMRKLDHVYNTNGIYGFYPLNSGSFFMDSKMNLYFALIDQFQYRIFTPLNDGKQIHFGQNQDGEESFGAGDWIEHEGKVYFRSLSNEDRDLERTLHVVDVTQGTLIKSSKHKNVKTVSPWFRLSANGEPGLLLLRMDSALPIGINGTPSGPRLKMNTLKESFESKIYYDPDGLPYLVIGNVGSARIFSLLQKIAK